MARVVLPLLGVEARGAIGKAIVYMPIGHATDGLTSVRVWTKPTNPESESQGDVRLRMKAVGHGISKIVADSALQSQIAAATPAGEIWNAYFVKTVMGAAFATIDASLTAWETAANSAGWISVAESLGMEDQDISYASIAPITAGEILFCQARAAYDLSLDIAPDDAQSLSSDNVASFGAALLA